jgi:signal transduction histidine kinase
LDNGFRTGVTEVIQNPTITKQMLIDLVKRSKGEILLLFPTINSFLREYKIGIFNNLKESAIELDVVIKILTPTNDKINKIVQNIKGNNFKNLILYPFETASEIKINTVTIIVTDKKELLVIENIDDLKENFEDAIGLAIYSASKPIVVSYVSIFESLINQIKLYDQLKISDIFKNEFLSVISHELRTPLVPIKGYTEILLNQKLLGQLNDGQRKALQSILRNTEIQESLVEEILNIYSFETTKISLSKRTVLVTELLDNVINDLHPLFIEKSVSLSKEVNTKIGDTIYCNEKKIEQVLKNLIKNSIDFVPKDKGNITITIEKMDNTLSNINDYNNYITTPNILLSYYIFTIKDNGSGIPEEKIDLLFKKFNKIDTTATRKYGGTGLGLAICKDIIELHGGKIWIDKNYKNGASIKFTILEKAS